MYSSLPRRTSSSTEVAYMGPLAAAVVAIARPKTAASKDVMVNLVLMIKTPATSPAAQAGT